MKVTQFKSKNGSDKRQLDTLRSLGLRRIGHTVEVKDTPEARGMVHRVRHLVRIEEKLMTPPAPGDDDATAPREADRPQHAEARAGQPQAAQARRPRPRLGHGQDLGPRPQGRGLALGLQGPPRLRGRPDADPHADAQAARPAHEEVDAVRDVPHAHPGGEPRSISRRASRAAPR